MDVLSDVLAAMRAGQPYAGRSTCRAPWGVRFPASDAACCHIVLQGGCSLVPADGSPVVTLGVGDILFTGPRHAHTLADQPGSPAVEFEPNRGSGYSVVELDIPGPGAVTEILCVCYTFDVVRPHPLLRTLPPVIHLPARIGEHRALRATVDMLGSELHRPGSGTDAILPALIDMLLLYVLRAWLDEDADRTTTGWATALTDPAIATALHLIHRQPENQWTVEELANHAGVSRATFAKRFTTVVGQPPLTYLTWWRMITAARLLDRTDSPIHTIAQRCGYSSEYAFSKAFKREYGLPPGQYRRQQQPV
ncbi:MAG: transcriptional regulator, AraC family [Nocardia sp.]|uniref:AraC family transcriptional regulator n=1 Tax=Nocardia sp. TaxID=1821 RepID=UPI00262E4904|nr:AraC family transcriptional regulator [Nocardia sp.]MCU1640154.1 transcriptional regulator, AraC family [Nocardia sp.]